DVKAVCSRDRRRFHGELEPRDLTWADVRPVPADHRQRRRAVVLRPPSVGRTVRAVPPNEARLVLTRLRVPRPEVRGRIRSDCPTERARVVVGDDGARDLARAKRGITGLPVPGGVESGDTRRYAGGRGDAWSHARRASCCGGAPSLHSLYERSQAADHGDCAEDESQPPPSFHLTT